MFTEYTACFVFAKHDLPGRQQIWASGRSFFSMTFADYHEKNHYVITSICTFFRNHKNVLKKRDFLWSETKLFKSAPLYLSLALSFLAGIALLDIISWNLLSCGSYICDGLFPIRYLPVDIKPELMKKNSCRVFSYLFQDWIKELSTSCTEVFLDSFAPTDICGACHQKLLANTTHLSYV